MALNLLDGGLRHAAAIATRAASLQTLADAAHMLTTRSTEYPTSPLQQFGFAIIFFFPLLALIVVGLRVYSRVQTKQFGLDDALIVVTLMLSIGETASTYMFMKTNFIGIHVWDIPAEYDVEQALIWNFAVQVLYNPILALVKTSMLLFLLKLGSHKPGVRWSIHALNALNLSLMVAIFLVVIFQCNPIAYNWNTSIAGGHCIDQGLFYLVTAATTIFTDVLNLALPFWIFIDLKMPTRVKIALLFVFLLGAIVTIVGIVRLVFVYQGFFQAPGNDPTYSLGFCTSAIETNLAIICASAPALRGLVRSWFPRFFSSGYNENYNGAYYDDNGYGAGNRATNPYGTGSIATNITGRRAKSGANGTVVTGGEAGGSGVPSFALRDLKGPSKSHTVVKSSPNGSEEEIMTYNGIMRSTDVHVQYDQESAHPGSAKRDRSGDRGSSMGMRTSISGSI